MEVTHALLWTFGVSCFLWYARVCYVCYWVWYYDKLEKRDAVLRENRAHER